MRIDPMFALINRQLARRGVLADELNYWEDRRTCSHCVTARILGLTVSVTVDTFDLAQDVKHFAGSGGELRLLDKVANLIVEKLANDLQQAGL